MPAVTFEELRLALECPSPNCSCHKDRHPNRHCPGHDDATPSFTMTRQPSGKVTVHCKKGCSQDAVIDALKTRELWPVDTEERDPRAPRRQKLTREWEYIDPTSGEVLAVHGRFDFIDRDEEGQLGKEFRWRTATGTYAKGLDGRRMSTLPLYNAHLIQAEPDETIWICEGEKAADAATDHGLIAVSPPGGASQKDFGHQLDWLQTRSVVLWPDNDDAGVGLMAHIATLLPHAKVVAVPGAQLRGDDAADYFAREAPEPEEGEEPKGRVDLLLEALKDPQPVARHTPTGVEVEYPTPMGSLVFDFRQINPEQNSLRAYLEASHTLAGRPGGTCNQRIDIVSGSQQNQLTTRLRAMFGNNLKQNDPINWTTVVNRSCSLAEEAYMGKVKATSLDQVPEETEEEYVIDGFLPRGQLTTLFADGGTGKTYTGIYAAICVIMGFPFFERAVRSAQIDHVLFVDYESTPEVIRRRFIRVCKGMGLDPDALLDHFHYFPGRGIPLEHQANQLERALLDTKSKFMIIDSAAAAAGGEPEKSSSALTVFNTVNILPPDTTTLLIAHNTKEQQTDKPFGSVFWHNNSRMTWYVGGAQPPGADYIHIGMWNRKVNDDAAQRPFGGLISFSDEHGVTFELEEPMDPSVRPTRRMELSAAVVQTLGQETAFAGMTTTQLATALEADGVSAKSQSLRNALNRLKDNDVVHSLRQGRSTVWRLNMNREQDEYDTPEPEGEQEGMQL